MLPDSTDDEHVVVRPERHEQDGHGERDVVGELVVPENALEQMGSEPEGGAEGENARCEQEQRSDERAQEQNEEEEVDAEGCESDARQVAQHHRDRVLGERGAVRRPRPHPCSASPAARSQTANGGPPRPAVHVLSPKELVTRCDEHRP